MPRELSTSPGAVRQRRFRVKHKKPDGAGASEAGPVPSGQSTAAETPSPAPSSVTLHETKPVTGSRDAWVSVPTIAAVGEGGKEVPIADAAPAPVTVTTPEEAAMLAKGVGAFCVFGWSALAARNRAGIDPLLEAFTAEHPELAKLSADERVVLGLAIARGVVEKSAAAVIVKHNIRVPYQDELVVAAGVGAAVYGLVPGKATQPTEAQRVAAAKDANPAPRPAAPEPATWGAGVSTGGGTFDL